MIYSLEQFEADMEAAKPRTFDVWVLPLFLVGYAIRSKGMGKAARRILCTAGIYMGLRNYMIYKQTILPVIEKMRTAIGVKEA